VTPLFDAARLLVLFLMGGASLTSDVGIATRFGDPGDRTNGAHLSCTHQPMQPGQLACAHRTLPCGSVLVLHNPRTRRLATCEVLDRGPFGAILPSGRWGVKIRASQPGTWRGIIDLSPAVAQALDHNGRERIELVYQRVASRLHEGRGVPRAGVTDPR
jgi:rare lipoprotein A (peptidoglycan hydrolase)